MVAFLDIVTEKGKAWHAPWLELVRKLTAFGAIPAAYAATSTSSVVIAAGALPFTIQAGKSYKVGDVLLGYSAADVTKYVVGTVSAYNSGSGALELTVASGDTSGSGAVSDWKFELSRSGGATGATGGITGGTMTGNLDFDGNDALNVGGVTNALIDKGEVGTGTVTFDVSAAAKQKLTVTGALTIAFSNWPASGTYAECEVILVNGGVNVTLPAADFVVGDGTTSATFADTGVTLASSGTNRLLFSTIDAGANLECVAS